MPIYTLKLGVLDTTHLRGGATLPENSYQQIVRSFIRLDPKRKSKGLKGWYPAEQGIGLGIGLDISIMAALRKRAFALWVALRFTL